MSHGDVQMRAQAGDHEDRDGEHEQNDDGSGALGPEALRPVPEPPDDEGEAEDEQDVGEDRTDQGGLDDADKPRAKREYPEEELGEVAQRRLHDAGHPGPEAIAEPVDAAPHDACEYAQGRRRYDEGDDPSHVRIAGYPRSGGE